MFFASFFWTFILYYAVWIPFVVTALAFLIFFVSHKKKRRRIALCCGCVFALLTADSVWEGFLRTPEIIDRTVYIPNLPAGLEGYKIIHVSDIHASWLLGASRTRRLVKQINATPRDLICLTGDFVDGKVADRLADLAPLKQLHARDGVFGVSGNHEIYSGYKDWIKALRSLNIRMLETDVATLTNHKPPIVLAGLKTIEPGARKRNPPSAKPLVKLFEKTPSDGFRILLQHQPVDVKNAVQAGIRLMLSGHTHGGQIAGLGLLAWHENDHHLSGIYREGSVTLYVSPGVGLWAGFPYRFLTRAEMTRLILRRSLRPH